MQTAMKPSRRGVLFEMLRRQHMSERTTQALNAQEKERLEEVQAQAFLKRALMSWDAPPVYDIEEPETASAPEPRGYHEFFRAVRA